jgi:hypothetical protein
MKSIYLVILLVFSTTSTAQHKTSYTSAPDLTVIKSKLISIISVDVSSPDPPPQDNVSPSYNPPRYEWQGKAELEVQNTGSKSIKSIDWEFFLIVEENSEKTTRSYRIRSKKAIRPGEIAKVTGWFQDAYLKALRKRLKEGLLQGQAEIKRINYADGRIWLPLKLRLKQQESR